MTRLGKQISLHELLNAICYACCYLYFTYSVKRLLLVVFPLKIVFVVWGMGNCCLLILGGAPVADCRRGGGSIPQLITATEGSAVGKPRSTIGTSLGGPTISEGAPSVAPHSVAGGSQSHVPHLRVAYGLRAGPSHTQHLFLSCTLHPQLPAFYVGEVSESNTLTALNA